MPPRLPLVLAIVLSGCAHRAMLSMEPAPPDTSHSLILAGYDGIAHACPIGPKVALTAYHVAMGRMTSRFGEPGPSKYAASAEDGFTGFASVLSASDTMDLAIVRLEAIVEAPGAFYAISENSPRPGESVYFLDFKRKKWLAFQEKLIRAQVVTVLPRHLILSDFPQGGASGGCVWNSSGEVVGIISGRLDLEDMREPLAENGWAGIAAVPLPFMAEEAEATLEKALEIEAAID